jgi:hypothetical protein
LQCPSVNTNNPSYLRNRVILLHIYVALRHLSSKKRTRMSATSNAPIRVTKRVSHSSHSSKRLMPSMRVRSY